MTKPHLINFKSIGSSNIGYLSVAEENKEVPFEIKRAYWTYFTPQDVIRGGHANIEKELVLIAVAGTIAVNIELQDGFKAEFILSNSEKT
jgi:hypothetical protein